MVRNVPSPLRTSILCDVKDSIVNHTLPIGKRRDSRGEKGKWGRMWEERRQREVTATKEQRQKEDHERKNYKPKSVDYR